MSNPARTRNCSLNTEILSSISQTTPRVLQPFFAPLVSLRNPDFTTFFSLYISKWLFSSKMDIFMLPSYFSHMRKIVTLTNHITGTLYLPACLPFPHPFHLLQLRMYISFQIDWRFFQSRFPFL